MLGVGVGHSPSFIGGIVAYPVNTVAPAITGSLARGSTLTCSTGTWLNTPTSFAYQWYEGGAAVGTNANTYVSTSVGASIYCNVTATNALGSSGAVAAAVGPITGSGLATPTLSNFSSLGAAPVVLQGSTTDYVAGYRGQLQVATDSGFGTITQNQIFFIDGNSWASNDIATGLVSPTGTYWARWRVLRDNENGTTVTGNDPLGNALSFGADVSSWSNTFTDTITSSVAVLNSVNGVNKNSNIAVTGTPTLNFLGSATGAYSSSRATVQAQSDFTYWEVTLTTLAGSDFLTVGIGTSATSFAGFAAPGLTDATGVGVKINTTTCNMNWNTDSSGLVLTSGAGTGQANDVFGLLLKKSTNQLSVFRTRAGVTTQMGATQTIPSFASYFAYVSTRQPWGGTCNFGATAFARTLGTETFYG